MLQENWILDIPLWQGILALIAVILLLGSPLWARLYLLYIKRTDKEDVEEKITEKEKKRLERQRRKEIRRNKRRKK